MGGYAEKGIDRAGGGDLVLRGGRIIDFLQFSEDGSIFNYLVKKVIVGGRIREKSVAGSDAESEEIAD